MTARGRSETPSTDSGGAQVAIGGGAHQVNQYVQTYVENIVQRPAWPTIPAPAWRVFVSHTSELRDFPRGMSYVAAVERAISAAGYVVVNMADFPTADRPAAQVCAERVRGCDVYVGVLG